MLNNFIQSILSYLGDYSSLDIDHGRYEQEVVSHGAASGPELYDFCLKVIEQKFPHVQNLKILDLACGQGPFGKRAKELNKQYLIDGMDIFVPENQELEQSEIYNKIIEVDILKHDFQNIQGRYDLIVSNQFFEHLYPKDAIDLLRKISQSGASILISVPLPYQTFAYTKQYLLASFKETTEFSKLLATVAEAEVHKSYFTKKLMKRLKFTAFPRPVYYSNFFYRDSQSRPPENFDIKEFFKVIPQEKTNAVYEKLCRKYRINRGNLPKREQYEKNLIKALLLEPFSFKIIRLLIFMLTNPLRIARKFFRRKPAS